MIIWINNANDVGKSHVAAELTELLTDRNTEYMEADLYWKDLLQNNFLKALFVFDPYSNKYFRIIFKKRGSPCFISYMKQEEKLSYLA